MAVGHVAMFGQRLVVDADIAIGICLLGMPRPARDFEFNRRAGWNDGISSPKIVIHPR